MERMTHDKMQRLLEVGGICAKCGEVIPLYRPGTSPFWGVHVRSTDTAYAFCSPKCMQQWLFAEGCHDVYVPQSVFAPTPDLAGIRCPHCNHTTITVAQTDDPEWICTCDSCGHEWDMEADHEYRIRC